MNKDLHDILNQYLENQLSPERKSEVEKKLESNPEWQEGLRLILSLKANARELIKSEIRAQLDEPIIKPKSRISRSRIAMAAAACLFLTFATWGMISVLKTPSSNKLFSQTFELPKASKARNSADQNPAFSKLMESFNQGDYTLVLEDGAQLLKDKNQSQHSSIAYFHGLAALKLEQYEQALNSFDRINKESIYYPDGLWFSALSYLAKDQKENSLLHLNDLPEGYKSPNGIRADSLIKKLD